MSVNLHGLVGIGSKLACICSLTVDFKEINAIVVCIEFENHLRLFLHLKTVGIRPGSFLNYYTIGCDACDSLYGIIIKFEEDTLHLLHLSGGRSIYCHLRIAET